MIGFLAFLVLTTPNLRHGCLHSNPRLAASVICFPFHSSMPILLCAGYATRPASIQWASGAPSSGVVRLEREACNSYPWKAVIMDAWNQLSWSNGWHFVFWRPLVQISVRRPLFRLLVVLYSFFSQMAGWCHLKFETIISFHILPNSLVASHSVIWCCVVFGTDSVVQ